MPVLHQIACALKIRSRQPDFWLQASIFICLGLALLPITRWLAETAFEQSRLLHALVVLLLAGSLLIADRQEPLGATLHLGKNASAAAASAYLLLAGGLLLPNPALVLAAYCAGLGAFFLFVFGESIRRVTFSLCATLFVFLLLSLAMAPLDWPLRTLAGQWSATVLAWTGKSVELGLVDAPGSPPMLILLVDRHPFHVAAECNGFGVIFTCLLLAFLLSLHRRVSILDGVLNLASGLTLGFALNITRIVIIVLLAPQFMSQYQLMHEIVGGLTYWGCLVLLWILLKGPTGSLRKPRRARLDGE